MDVFNTRRLNISKVIFFTTKNEHASESFPESIEAKEQQHTDVQEFFYPIIQ